MLSERLALLISLDANQAVRGLETVGKAADRNLGKTESRLDRMGQRFQKAGAGMLATAGLLATGLYKAGMAAGDLEQAVGGTEAVFKDASGYIDGFAKDAARTMGLSERAFREATTRMGGQLKGLGFSIDDAAEKSVVLTQVAADLAATYGGTTADAVDALAAAFRGEADPAERFNLRLNQSTVNAKALEMGLAESTSQVSAAAKAQATLALIMEQSIDAQGQFGRESDTTAGRLQIMNAEFENMKAQLGSAVAPVIADVAGKLADLAAWVSSANEATGGLIGTFAAWGTIGLGAAGGLSLVVGKVIQMRENLSKLTGPLKTADGGLNTFGKGLAALGWAGAIFGAIQFARSLNTVTVDVDELAHATANLNAEQEQQLHTSLRVLAQWGDLDDVVAQTAASNMEAAERLVDQAEAAGITGDALEELRQILEDKRATEVQATLDQQANAQAMEEAVDAAGGLTVAIDDQTSAYKRHIDALAEATEAVMAQFDSQLRYRRSLDSVEDKLASVLELEQQGKTNTEEHSRAVLAAEDALLDQASAAVKLAEDQAKANGHTLTAQQRTSVYRGELVKLRDSMAPGSALRNALDSYIAQLDAVPESIRTQAILDTSQAMARLQELNRQIEATSGKTIYNYFGGTPGRNANGTSWWPGGMSIVGERGPEIVDLPRGSRVIDAQDTARMLGGGGTIVIPVHVGNREIDRIVVDAQTRSVRRGYAA